MSKINWAELMSLVDEQLEELSENDLVVFEEPINNTTPDLHKNISDNKIVSESQEEFFSCITTSDCYRKIKKYFIDREDEEVIAKDFDRKVALAIKSEQVEMVAFVEAWNKLVGKGLLWQHKLDGKTVYTFGEDEAKGKAEGPINKAKQPPKVISSGSEKLGGARTAGDCKGVPPPKAAMRFEWCVIESARMKVGAPTGTGDAAYACARSDDWRQMEHGGSTIGELADESITLCVNSGFFSKANFAGATMEEVGKKPPAWGGPSIQPKTDIRFGDKNISIKLSGDIQAASAEAANTAPQLQFIVDEWLRENAADSVEDAAIKAAQEETAKLFAEAKTEMLEHGEKQFITHGRAANMLSDIEKEKSKGKKADLKKIEKYKNALEALEQQGIINQLGEVIVRNFDYDDWQEKFGNEIRRKLKAIFTEVVKESAEGPTASQSLRNVLVDEILSGRRIFAEAPEAIAQYIVSPDHIFSLMPEDGAAYAKTIATFAKIIKVDVRSKGGRAISKDGRLVGIGCKPSYRFDIRGKDIEGAFKEVEAEMAKAQEKRAEQGFMAEAVDTPGMGELEKKIDNIMDTLEKKLTHQMVNSLDVEETVQSMAGKEKREQKEHLTNTRLSYIMLSEMINELTSDE